MVLFASPETAAIEYFGYVAPVSQLLQKCPDGNQIKDSYPERYKSYI